MLLLILRLDLLDLPPFQPGLHRQIAHDANQIAGWVGDVHEFLLLFQTPFPHLHQRAKHLYGCLHLDQRFEHGFYASRRIRASELAQLLLERGSCHGPGLSECLIAGGERLFVYLLASGGQAARVRGWQPSVDEVGRGSLCWLTPTQCFLVVFNGFLAIS